MSRPHLVGLCLLTVVLGTASPSARASSGSYRQQATAVSLLNSYIQSVHRGRPALEFEVIDLDDAREELSNIANTFLTAKSEPGLSGTPGMIERQRRILTAFALELAGVGSIKQPAAAARLIEWACGYVRGHAPRNAFDHAWQLAALSVLEGGLDSRVLLNHVEHAQTAFPDEPRLVLARAIADEQFTAPAETTYVRTAAERQRAAERAITRLSQAATVPGLGPEANLRLGHVQLGLKRYEEALTAWAKIEPSTEDLALVYLVRLFRGLALEGLSRPADAKASYLAALEVSPGAHSATMRLAGLAFRHGRHEELEPLLATLLRDNDPRRDPWWSYYAADFRFWYARLDLVRKQIVP